MAIDAGRFVDYIEMDAASNRGVEEMTQLLERAAYAPSNARFKVYTIDEVHMLTNHAFNAMLKTLEEPPDYVKFILATTEPHKIPVTVLSRCLQFNLKQVAPVAIVERLAHVLEREGMPADGAPLRALALAARGSMRDALSLLDQAIAFSAGAPTLETVHQMLGAIDTTLLVQLVDAIADGQAQAVLALADAMAERGLAFSQALRDLASLLHRIAIAQGLPEPAEEDAGEDTNATHIRRLAQKISREQVQLYYQIALHGRNDMGLAPDEYAGFTMTLLRMLAFAPELASAAPPARSAALHATRPPRSTVPLARKAGETTGSARIAPPLPQGAGGAGGGGSGSEGAVGESTAGEIAAVAPPVDWPAMAARLKLTGLARELTLRSELVACEGDHFTLRVPVKALLEAGNEARLKVALAEHLGRPVRLTMQLGAVGEATAARRGEEARALRQKQAEDAIYADPFVRELIENFSASVDPRSIRPATPEA